MQLTHEEAHRLIQYDLDHALHAEQRAPLLAHLYECDDCRAYADGMHNLQNILRGVMRKQWEQTPLPLSIASLKPRRIFRKDRPLLPGLQTALISVVLVVFSLFVWQFTTSGVSSPGQAALTVYPVPTPSIQLSTASLESTKCASSIHKVKEFETLDGIALRYSVPKEAIISFNHLNSEQIDESMSLSIPNCKAIPTTTATTTRTPIFELTLYTPG